MPLYQLIEEEFITPLGIVNCGLSSSEAIIKKMGVRKYKNGSSVSYETLSHSIEIITFKRNLPLYNGDSVDGLQGWVWRINKKSDLSESIELTCLLTNPVDNTELNGPDPGEHLESVMITNDNWVLHIGTEDGEIMASRALHEDWMPLRFKDEPGFFNSFTAITSNGLKTTVPKLKPGEQIHFHYLTAFDKKQDQKINTWLAVDASKEELENWIGVG